MTKKLNLNGLKGFKKCANTWTMHLKQLAVTAQNGLAEKPNQDLAKIMRCLLYSSWLGSEYWSYALRHAVYLKNRLPHSANQWRTPYTCTVVNGKKPDLSRLRIFGSKVQIKHSNKRQKKLDKISREGLFMTYKGTDKIVYIVNKQGKQGDTIGLV